MTADASAAEAIASQDWHNWYRLVSNHEDERHRTPPEKMALDCY